MPFSWSKVVHSLAATEDHHLRILPEEAYCLVHPVEAVEVVVILKECYDVGISEADGLVVHDILIKVVGPDEELASSCQPFCQTMGMFLVGTVVYHYDFCRRVFAEFLDYVHHLQTLVVGLDDEADGWIIAVSP